MQIQYRNDIDGIRALAVVAVVLFHLGFLPNGFLGVDVFFVISGYLITGIIHRELKDGSFSVLRFYERRLRRIVPLVLVVCLVSLVVGCVLMLPDDLENLCQSIVASNFSANNILMYITSADYWAVKNEYKPLMHTWSLGIEEQFYLFFPFILMAFNGKGEKFLKYGLFSLILISFLLYLTSDDVASRFYFLHYRFFELAVGGIFSIFMVPREDDENRKQIISTFSLGVVVSILAIPPYWLNSKLTLILVVLFTCILLANGNVAGKKSGIYKAVMVNKVMVYIGRLSFSIYMWHQLVFAFARYSFLDHVNLGWSVVLCIVVLILSIISYNLIENPFRNRAFISARKLMIFVGLGLFASTMASFYIYGMSGVVKDYPELDFYTRDQRFHSNIFQRTGNININYNERIRDLDKEFKPTPKRKLLVIGNSFGRDLANIFLETPCVRDSVELNYFDILRVDKDSSIKSRIVSADIICISSSVFIGKEFVSNLENKYGINIDFSHLWFFGTKDFGLTNGTHYRRFQSDKKNEIYWTSVKDGVLAINKKMKSEWGINYVDMLSPVSNEKSEVRVFTPNGKFISQDTEHLTKSGAIYYSQLLDKTIRMIMESK
jgi:peptidoglycan/LPS O-acetylase OafA/YrhL